MKATDGIVRHLALWLLFAGSTAWAVGLVGAPFVLTHDRLSTGLVRAAAVTYVIGRVVCHQRQDRSFRAWGLSLPVCTRCSGLYAAAPLGVLLGVTFGTRPWRRSRRALLDLARRGLVVAALPTIGAAGAEYLLGLPVGGWMRALAAAPLALAVGWVVAAAIRGELGLEAGVH